MVQIIENLLLLTLGLAVVLNCLPKGIFGKYVRWFAYAAVAFTLLDIILGHYRWQMVPAYFISILMLLLPRFRKPNEKKTHWIKKLLFSGYVLLSLVIFSLAVLFPKAFIMFELPTPTGQYKVGIKDIHLIDKSRREVATDDTTDYREVMVRAWYPAEIEKNDTPEPFLREIEPVHQIFRRSIPIPAFILSHLKKIPSHSYLNARTAKSPEKFPVLVFSHGNSFYASQNTLLMEHLASNGYVILAIDHPYQASWVKFPNGKIATYENGKMPEAPSQKEIDKAMESIKGYAKTLAYGPHEKYYNETKLMLHSEDSKINDRIQIWADDVNFVVDELEKGKEKLAQLANVVDLNQMGVFGMSLGGATAGKICSENSRFKAGINMDGRQYGHGAIDYKLKKPFMMMNGDRRLDFSSFLEEKWDENKPLAFEMNDYLLDQSKDISYNIVIKNSTHGCFSDFLIMTQNFGSWTGFLGKIDPWEMKVFLDDYTLAFFDKHIKGFEEPILDENSKSLNPNIVKFEIRNGLERTDTSENE